jgi:hypothetical protein
MRAEREKRINCNKENWGKQNNDWAGGVTDKIKRASNYINNIH